MKITWTAVLMLAWMVNFPASLAANAQGSDVAVVVNQANPVNAITLAELRKVFAAERRSWAVGMPIKLIMSPAGTPEHGALLRLLGMSERAYKQYWIAEIFRGEVEAEPLSLPSVELQAQAMAIFPGAITFLAPGDVKTGMKVIKVDGYLPGEAGYPVH